MKKIYKYNKKKFITAFKLFFNEYKKSLSLREKLFSYQVTKDFFEFFGAFSLKNQERRRRRRQDRRRET
jgi:hypothetical protein